MTEIGCLAFLYTKKKLRAPILLMIMTLLKVLIGHLLAILPSVRKDGILGNGLIADDVVGKAQFIVTTSMKQTHDRFGA
jgi:hypothetical protein